MTRRNRVVGLSLCCTALVGLVGCVRSPLSGPPELRVGREECAECGMLVNEDRCSGAALIDREGERLYVFFDDIGCMLDYEHDKAGTIGVLEPYVHDYTTRRWIPSALGVYLLASEERLRTPMGSGIVAFASTDAAKHAQKEYGGTVMDHAGLVPARRAWMETRYGKAKD